MKKNSNAAKISPGTKIKASDDDYIIKQGKNDVISLKTHTGEKFTFKTFTDAFNKVADLQKRTDEGLRKAKVISLNGNVMTFDLAKAAKETNEYERIKALDSNLGKAPAKKAKRPTTGWMIEEYSIGEKWHLSGTDEKGDPWVYATEAEAEKAIANNIEEWKEAGMEYGEDDFRVISLEEYEAKVKAVMKEYDLGPKAAREFLYSGSRLGNKAGGKKPAKNRAVNINKNIPPALDALIDAKIPMINYGHGQFYVSEEYLVKTRQILKKAGVPFRETDLTIEGQYKPRHLIIIENDPEPAKNKAYIKQLESGKME